MIARWREFREAFTNRQLAIRTTQFLDGPYTSRQATYDLRRLKRKGLIRRLRKKHRYELTPLGRGVAVLFTKTYGRVLSPGLALFDPQPVRRTRSPISPRSRLASAEPRPRGFHGNQSRRGLNEDLTGV